MKSVSIKRLLINNKCRLALTFLLILLCALTGCQTTPPEKEEDINPLTAGLDYPPESEESALPEVTFITELSSQDIEQLSDDELCDIFYNDDLLFTNFGGIRTNGVAILFSADEPDEAIKLLNSAMGFQDIMLIGENELFYSFEYKLNSENKGRINVYKNSIFFTNFGLGENLPEAFKDRPLIDKFTNPSKDSIKMVYDTQYGGSYISNASASKILASFVVETDNEFHYILYRLDGSNGIMNKAENAMLNKMTITIDGNSGEQKAFDIQNVRTVQLK